MHYLASKLSDKTWIGEENALQEKVHYVPGKVSEWNENLVPELYYVNYVNYKTSV